MIDAGLPPGSVFANHYEVVSRLGFRGDTYECRDRRSGHHVAVKILPKPQPVEAFPQHVHLVRMLDSGDFWGQAFVVTEFVRGQSLADLLAVSSGLAPAEALNYFAQICNGLAALHSREIAHGDLKPSNILISEANVVKLAGYGEGISTAAGTRSYMAPEVIAGGAPSPASDVYSAGVLLRDLFSGRLPVDLIPVIDRCLQSDPSARYPSATDLLLIVDSSGVSAEPPSGAVALTALITDDPSDIRTAVPLMERIAKAAVELRRSHRNNKEFAPENILVTADRIEIATQDHHWWPRASGRGPATWIPSRPKHTPRDVFAEAPVDESTAERADVYALGVTFYDLIAGRRAMAKHVGEPDERSVQWLRWHADLARRLPPLTAANPDAPKQLESLIARMTEKDAHQRIGTLAEVAQELESIRQRLRPTEERTAAPIQAEDRETEVLPLPQLPQPQRRPPPSRPVSDAPPPERRVPLLWIAAVLALAALAALAWWLLLPGKPSAAKADPPPVSSPPAKPKPTPITAILAKSIDTPTGTMLLVSDAADAPLFYMDKTEVTNGMYRRFCEASGRPMPEPPKGDAGYFSKADLPVVNVSFDDASAYAKWAQKRLPTESEWVTAARGHDGRQHPWGGWMTPAVANLLGKDDGYPTSSPVGLFAFDTSPFGILDMGGNVHEWATTPAGPTALGGGFDTEPAQLNIAAGTRMTGDRLDSVGFRCVMDPAMAPK